MNEDRKQDRNDTNRDGDEMTTRGSSPERTRSRAVLVPRADIYETKDEVHLVTDMPGVDESSVEITLEKNVLTITGRVQPRDVEGYRRVHSELRDGDYSRSFQLSNEVDTANIKATVKHGVLRLAVPKIRAATRKIPVAVE